MSIKVMIVDNHELVRVGLVTLLKDADMDVVGQAADSASAIALAEKKRPHIAVVDVRMREGDGIDAIEKIREKSPNTKVIMLSSFDNPTYKARSAALGASAYVLKDNSRDEILKVIRAVAGGEEPLKAEAQRLTARQTQPIPVKDGVSLTQRESQVLRHLAQGLSNREIGLALKISVDTVKEHVQNILRKVHATDRTQVAVWAVKNGLV
ncbi:MAG: response regulator [Pirellulales bacterium]